MFFMEFLKIGFNFFFKMSFLDFIDYGYGFNKELMKISVSGSQKYFSEKSSFFLIGLIKSIFKFKFSSLK